MCDHLHLCVNASSAVVPKQPEIVYQPENNGTACDACEYLFEQTAKYLPADYTQQELETLMQTTCTWLVEYPKAENYCDAIVLLYIEDIYNAMSGKVPPSQVCSALHLCH